MTPEIATAGVMLAALTLYVLFGGADYGAGVWDLIARGPRAASQRDLIAHAIGPVWEANHVWLILVIVLLFSGFPAAFSAIMTSLHAPLSLMLVGVVLRGSAFTFRAYDPNPRARKRWNRIFSIPSVATPILLGAVIGAISTGKVGLEPNRATAVWSWLGPFPLTVGLFALAIFAFLAAVYLTLETTDEALQEDFRIRALAAAVVVGILAYATYLLATKSAPALVKGLGTSDWGLVVRIATGAFAVAVIAALWFRRYHEARIAAMIQVALILWGCALAQYPYLIPPDMTIASAAAPRTTLYALLIALTVGSVILFPSLVFLFRVFKLHTFRHGKTAATEPLDHPDPA